MESGEMDLLSKQAILSLPRDVVKSLDGKILDEYINVKDIEALPTVQSQSTAGQLNDSAQSTNLIDRQAAIDALDKLHKEDIEDYGCEIPEGFNQDNLDRAIFAIKQLPTIQPVATDTNVGDTISRQAAIDVASGYCHPANIADELRKLPTVQPETAKRIVGKSRDGMTLWYQCDMCNEPVDEQDNYCRGCGRRLIDG